MSFDLLSAEASAPVFYFDEFTFDCGSRLLRHKGKERHLSPKAQLLLRLLIEARPRAMSRQDLYDALWPSTYVSETNLAGIVKEVRRALDDASQAPFYIRTVHGFGYAFCGEVGTALARPIVARLLCEGRDHPLYQGDNLVGRALDARVVLEHPSVSRRHAMITIDDESIVIRDLESKNGTFLNERLIQTTEVLHRSRIAFGAVTATVLMKGLSSTWSLQLDLAELKQQLAERAALA